MRWSILSIFLFLCAVMSAPLSARAATGFVAGPMWIFPEAPKQGQGVTLSALFHNGENTSISGTVLFYDADTLLGRKTIVIPAGGVGTATTFFTIGAGSHTFSAKMSSLVERASDGSETPLALPLETARMSTIEVAPLAASTSANAHTSTTTTPSSTVESTSSPILNQIDATESKVLAVLPPVVKTTVADTVQAVDTWRADQATSFTDAKKKAQAVVASSSITAEREQKLYGHVSPTTKYIDGPFAYVKLAFFWLLSFLFSYAALFYIVALVVGFLVLRALFRRIARVVRERRAAYHYASIPKAPRI